MNTNDEYQIYYKFTENSRIRKWIINISKLNITLAYQVNTSGFSHIVARHLKKHDYQIINNFVIESTLVDMIKSSDKLTRNLAFEILNNKLNDRTGFNTKESDRPMVSK